MLLFGGSGAGVIWDQTGYGLELYPIFREDTDDRTRPWPRPLLERLKIDLEKKATG